MKHLAWASAFAERRIWRGLARDMETVLRFALEADQAAVAIDQHGVSRNLKQRPETVALRLRKRSAVPAIQHKQRALSGSARGGGLLQLVKCAGQRDYAPMSLHSGSC